MLEKLSKDEKWKQTPRFIVVLWDDSAALETDRAKAEIRLSGEEMKARAGVAADTAVHTYEEMLLLSPKEDIKHVPRDNSSLATLVYTSGTTSFPKGVRLLHSNILHQVNYNTFSLVDSDRWDPNVGDTVLSILPCWHIYERTSEYFCFARGVQMVYSQLRTFKSDLVDWKPHYLFAVPRLFETIHKGALANFRTQSRGKQKLIAAFTAITQTYKRCIGIATNQSVGASKPNVLYRIIAAIGSMLLFPFYMIADKLVWSKVRASLGGNFKVLTSGGSSLPMFIEKFFSMIGLNIIVGYGLTESSPIILNRYVEDNVIGTVGKPCVGTECKIVDTESGKTVTPGQEGVLFAKGPAIMQGYNKNGDATAAAFDSEGYFDTGDIAKQNLATGDVMITGRAKDTIVLSNGENVAPQPLEEQIVGAGRLVDQAMLVGQDERFMAAVLVLNAGELAEAGLIDKKLGQKLSQIVGPTPVTTGPMGDLAVLKKAAKDISKMPAVRQAVQQQLDVVNSDAERRNWEKVSAFHAVLEPFR